MKLLAIDGNSIINRAFYGIRLLSTKDGQYTNGIYGFINILNKLIALENPDGVVVAFDLHAPTFRHEKYSEYKAGRKGMPDELRSQMPLLKKWLDLMGYHRIELEGYEADDILGTLAAAADKSGNECIISTGDRDALQLVSSNTRVLLTATKAGHPELINYDMAALYQKYGVTPDGMIELKALMGDSSDNIPGVAGVGEKTASALITTYKSIDYIYENIDSLDIKDNLKNKLIVGKENAYLSRWLGKINREVPIDTDLSHYLPKEQNTAELIPFMTGLELFKLMENMGLTADFTEIADTDSGNALTLVSADNFKPENTADVYADFESGRIGIVSGKFICDFDFENDRKSIKDILESKDIKKRVYDYKNLYKWAQNNGISLGGITFDSMLAGYIASPSASSYDVTRLGAEYHAQMPKIEGDSYEFIASAALHSSVCDKLYEELENNAQLSLLTDIELPLAKVLGEMELNGFLIDSQGIEKYGQELAERIENIQNEIYSLVGYEFNLNSPKQLGVALFEKLGLPAGKKTKNGYSTSADVLEGLKDAHPAVALLLEYRTLSKLKSTYCDGLLGAVDPDGRIRSTFNQTETRTGRISSLEPNLQNIPVRREEGKILRKFFIAKEGYSLCDADYSQIELRVLAHIADDQNMINAFSSGADIHTLTAATAFDMPLDMVTPVMRSRAKAVNFGIVYGIGAFSLAKDIGVTRAEADRYIKGYLAAYPSVDRYMKSIIEKARNDGYVSTLFGRRRYLPELASSNKMLQGFGERVARNAPIQGTAADIIKIAMVKVSERLKKENLDARLILQVHDELIVECRDEICDTVCEILEQEMRSAAEMKVTLSVDAHSGKSWFEAKE
ncbi:MAG: DNA polymerase I [Ruminococcaceae bacterium]|nr:DNA polymerase I [Oscillospiraceae bacterium]